MKERKLIWCDYEIMPSTRPNQRFYIQQNGTWQGRGSAHVLLEEGFRFKVEGESSVLWLIRDGKVEELVTRVAGEIRAVNPMMVIHGSVPEIHIHKDLEWIKMGDGFATLPVGISLEPGPIDTVDGIPRPTMWSW